MGDLEADLVDVPRQHDPGATAWVHGGEGIAVHVDPHVGGEGGGFLPPDAGGAHLKPGRTGGVEQLLEKNDVVSHELSRGEEFPGGRG